MPRKRTTKFLKGIPPKISAMGARWMDELSNMTKEDIRKSICWKKCCFNLCNINFLPDNEVSFSVPRCPPSSTASNVYVESRIHPWWNFCLLGVPGKSFPVQTTIAGKDVSNPSKSDSWILWKCVTSAVITLTEGRPP